MDINAKISRFHQEYRADLDAARIAEQRGNIEGARRLYKQAALALCEMATLESGETRKQRILLAQTLKEKAEQLSAPPPAVLPATPATPASAGPGRAASKPSANAAEDENNPWKSEGIPDISFDDVVGMEDVKALIRSRIIDQIKYPELYEQFGVKGGTGVLLFGLPGTGKTTIARAIAHEVNAPLYTVQLSDILNKWVGESEKRISQLFEKARSTPTSLIFFDDFDALGMARSDDGNHNNNKVIVELLNQIQGFHANTNTILLLAATNRPWMIDSALMRGQRFEHHIYVPLPNHEARIMLVKKKLGSAPVDPDMDMDRVSDLIRGYNGADIVSVVDSAKVAALQRSKELLAQTGESKLSPISFEDIARAVEGHKTSVDPGDIAQLRQYAAGRGIQLPEEM